MGTGLSNNQGFKNHPNQTVKMKPVCLFLILAVTFNLGNALKCHQCNSNTEGEEGCNKYGDDGAWEGEGGQWLKKCDASEDQSCRKIYQMIRDKESVIRTCGTEAPEE